MSTSESTPELDRTALGRRLLELRNEHGLSLRGAAQLAGLSSGFISLVERGKTSIAVSRLIRLADVYGVEVAHLLSPESEVLEGSLFVPRTRASVFRPAEQNVQVLYVPAPAWISQPFIVRMESGARLEGLHHHGHEFVHCTEGQPTVTVDEVIHVLGVGDTVFIPSGAQHEYANHSKNPITLVGASMPRTGLEAAHAVYSSVSPNSANADNLLFKQH